MSKAVTTTNSLKNCFLIAMPSLLDPHFSHSVVYLCEHNEHGCIGIVVNQLASMVLGEVFDQLGVPTDDEHVAKRLVFLGGLVHRERGFILHPVGTRWENTIEISPKIALTTSADILQAIARNQGPTDFLLALGYSHWDPGQLEKELSGNVWLYGPPSFDVMFHLPVELRWKAAAALMGVDTDKISDDVGHA